MIKIVRNTLLGTHWVSLFTDRNAAVYFDSFVIEYIPLEVLNKIKDKSITHNLFRIQDKESIMCVFILRYYYIILSYLLQITIGLEFRFEFRLRKID